MRRSRSAAIISSSLSRIRWAFASNQARSLGRNNVVTGSAAWLTFCRKIECEFAVAISFNSPESSAPSTASTAPGCAAARLSSQDGNPFNSSGAYRAARSASSTDNFRAQVTSSASAATAARPSCQRIRKVPFSFSARSERNVGVSLRHMLFIARRS
ncbi:hypothetical protein D3C87_1525580 [compost metagenome]